MTFNKTKLLLFHISKFLGLFKLSRFFTDKDVRILCYHNISVLDEYKFKPVLHIRQDTFIKRIKYLKKQNFIMLNLSEAITLLKEKKNLSNTLVVKFDDGWYSTMAYAHPVLKKYNIPYTIYLASHYSLTEFPVTNIIIPYIIWKSQLKETEVIKIFDLQFTAPGGNITDVINELVDKCNQLTSKNERLDFIKQISTALDVDCSDIIKNRSFEYLTGQEIKQLFNDGVDFQLHTHSHFFPEDEETASQQIAENQNYLESITGKKAKHFCYPSGRYKKGHFDILAKKNIDSAVTCLPGLNKKETHKYLLKDF